MANFLFFFILTTTLGLSTFAQPSEDITRLNAGIHFSYKGTTQLVSAVWRHVAILKLPEPTEIEIFDMDKHVPKNTQSGGYVISPKDTVLTEMDNIVRK